MSLDNVKNIVLILSGKGGVGKSSITVQLALSLCLAGKSVGILDVDLTGPSIPRLLGLENAKITQAPGGWLPVEVHASQTLEQIPQTQTPPSQKDASASGTASTNGNGDPSSSPSPATSANGAHPPTAVSSLSGPRIGSLHAISLAFLLPSRSSAVIWRGPKKTAMVRQFLTDVLWPPAGIDYLLIDTPPGTSDEHIALAETLLSCTTPLNATDPTPNSTTTSLPPRPHLAGAVVVTTPQAVAVSDVRKELNFCRKTGLAVLGVVENMAGFVCECCGEETNLFGKGGGEVMAADFHVPFLGRVSLDSAWGRLVEEGRRPRYGEVGPDQEGEAAERVGGQDGGDAREGEKASGEEHRDEGLLVDKYRSCRLSAGMSAITNMITKHVEGI